MLPAEKSPIRAELESGKRYWVASERLNRRTCPSVRCGVVGQHFFRQGLDALELRLGRRRDHRALETDGHPDEEHLRKLFEKRPRVIAAPFRRPFCICADQAVAALRRRGFDARRPEGGPPEWREEGRPVLAGPP